MDADQKQHEADRKLRFLQELLSDGHASEKDVVLKFFDDASKVAAFEHYWRKLEHSSPHLDLDALRVCVWLLPPPLENDLLFYKRLQRFVASRIQTEPEDSERTYKLAEICLSNAHYGYELFFEEIYPYLSSVTPDLFSGHKETITYENEDLPRESHIHRISTYLNFLKCSYWLPSGQNHVITPSILDLLLSFVGHDELGDLALDALSALFSLLYKDESVVVAQPHGGTESWLSLDPGTNKLTLNRPFVNQALWDRLQELDSTYFSSKSGKLFKIWFQWISLAADDGVDLDGLYQPLYWERLRIGLLTGFADQRKYCLGIIRHSLRIARRDVQTPLMELVVVKRSTYMSQYEKFSTLFETIVLDRYPNQVQACLPELSSLFGSGSLISPALVTALLAAALNPTVQDGIRKLIGNWYINYVIDETGDIIHHSSFLVEGFLPWATQGSLFTTSLVSTRTSTTCTHGTAFASVIARFMEAMPTDSDRRQLFARILQFILDAGGRIFQPSIPYILEGLLKGLVTNPIPFEGDEISIILRVSRLTGLPEIANDFYVVLCAHLCEAVAPDPSTLQDVPGYQALSAKFEALKAGKLVFAGDEQIMDDLLISDLPPIPAFLEQLSYSQHKIIQNAAFAPACKRIIGILDTKCPDRSEYSALYKILDALWEEADRQEYSRPVAVEMPPVLFHSACIQICVQQPENEIVTLLAKVMEKLQQLSEGRSYLLSNLSICLRKAAFLYPEILSILPFEDFLVRFISFPPSPKKEFLFEVAAAEKLQEYIPHRDYTSYYGQREWFAFAAMIDLLNRFPNEKLDIARRVLDRVLEPWGTQKPPVPIISKWKDVFQLQVMLLLTESCVEESQVEMYLDSFMHALFLEPWPRYRFVIEWIISRIYYRFPGKTERILVDLGNLDETSPIHVASLIKLALLAAPFLDSEEFALKLMIQLIPFSASPKVHIRHESHWSFPILFDLAKKKQWSSIINNPAFCALDKHVRKLDKYNAPPSTIRTLKLDAVNSYNITEIFQGQYLFIETPELQRVAQEDFLYLYAEPKASIVPLPQPRIPLRTLLPILTLTPTTLQEPSTIGASPAMTTTATPTPSFFQTKTTTTLSSLLPASTAPTSQTPRPTPLILIASLIDNPTNLGGLSRISESFGLQALYIDDLKKTTHKDFKATSVTSEKHLPIKELKGRDVPEFLVECKRKGYEIVGIEQTDRSGILGEEGTIRQDDNQYTDNNDGDGITHHGKMVDSGTLPQKCVLVLGSEKGGITSEVLAVLDRCVEIRTVGVTRSLNVQTAGGIAVYEWWREWGGKGTGKGKGKF